MSIFQSNLHNNSISIKIMAEKPDVLIKKELYYLSCLLFQFFVKVQACYNQVFETTAWFLIGRGYFDVNSILPLETILPKSFTCVYIAIIAILLPVMLWHVDSALVLKYNGQGLESWLAGHWKKGSVRWRGRPSVWMYRVVCIRRECTGWKSGHWGIKFF